MPMFSIRTAVTQTQTDYKTLRRSLVDALGFTPSSDEEDHSHVNTRTRCKKLFEPKEKEGRSEK